MIRYSKLDVCVAYFFKCFYLLLKSLRPALGSWEKIPSRTFIIIVNIRPPNRCEKSSVFSTIMKKYREAVPSGWVLLNWLFGEPIWPFIIVLIAFDCNFLGFPMRREKRPENLIESPKNFFCSGSFEQFILGLIRFQRRSARHRAARINYTLKIMFDNC